MLTRCLALSLALFTLVLSPSALAQTCTQTLPAPLTTFCANSPAVASDVNGNFATLANSISTKLGPLGNSSVAIESSSTVNIQNTSRQPTQVGGSLIVSGATQLNGTLQVGAGSTVSCGTSTAGTLRVRNGQLEACANGVWMVVTTAGSSYVSCLTILQANAAATDGAYVLNAGGNTVTAYCDMTGGGWTLIQAHTVTSGLGATLESRGTLPNSGTFLPASAVRAFARASSQVRFRHEGPSNPGSPLGVATSDSNGEAITQLRALVVLRVSNPGLWTYTGTLSASNFGSSCGSGGVYPDTYHACGNPSGAHVFPSFHGYSSGVQTDVSVWVR